MKYIMFFLLLVACSKEKAETIPSCSPTIRIEISNMNNYMKILPSILDFSTVFRNLPSADQLSDHDFNLKFYEALFDSPELSNKLKKASFSNPADFATFHETVLDLFLFLNQEEFSIKSAEQKNLELQKEINKLQLKIAREPQNNSLKKSLSELMCQEISFNNLLIVNQFKKDLNNLNKNAEL